MTDTIRTEAAILTLLADNIAGAISPQDLRDGIVSLFSADITQSSRTITASDTVLTTDDVILVDATAGAVTLTMLAAATIGKLLFVKKIDSTANAVTISGDANLDGQASIVISSQYDAVRLFSDLTEWWIL